MEQVRYAEEVKRDHIKYILHKAEREKDAQKGNLSGLGLDSPAEETENKRGNG